MALLKPEALPTIRQVYAGLVAEGILSKKSMKTYFQLLPGKNYAAIEASSYDLKDYPQTTLKQYSLTEVTPVNTEDVGLALQEMLPVVSAT